jgi:hypothetical protein
MMASVADVIRSNFEAFVRQAFAASHPDELIGDQSYVKFLCERIGRLYSGESHRLIVNLPPRHLKTFIGSICLPAYWLAHRPATEIIIVTYAEPLASEIGHQLQQVMQATWYLKLFPTRISPRRFSATNFATTQGGLVYAVSFEGSVTGYGADLLIVDDPLNISDADNEKHLEYVNTEFEPRLMSRLNRPKNGPVIVIAHRLAPNDLSGFLVQQGGWEHIALPFEAPTDVDYGTWQRKKGELLRPNDFSEVEVTRIKANPRFPTLYQQLIGSDEEAIRPEHFLRFFDYAIPRRERAVVLSVDASLSAGPNSSFNVIQAWCRKGEDHFLLDQWRGRGGFADLRDAYNSFCRQHNPVLAIIEKAANGIALIEHARRRRNKISVIEVVPDRRSKRARLAAHLPTIRNGHIQLPREADFIEDFLAELCAVNRTTFDQIDAAVQYLEVIGTQPPLKPPAPRSMGVRPTGPRKWWR